MLRKTSEIAASTEAGGSTFTRGDYWRWAKPVALAALFALAGFLLYRTLRGYDFDKLVDSVLSVPLDHLASAICWAAASYLCLTGFDWLGLRYVNKPLPYRKVALASFVSLSLGHNIGFDGLSSGAIRYRFYSREGLTAAEVAKLVMFSATTVGLGLMILAGISLIARPEEAGRIVGLGRTPLLAIAAACLIVPLGYLLLAWRVRRPLSIYRWEFETPNIRLALAQIVLGPLNFACVAACLHQVLSSSFDVSYLATASVFVLAVTAMLLAHIPGGLGVIESVIVYLMPESGVLPLVLVFRFVYFLLPLSIGGALFILSEFRASGTGDEAAR
ncbi:MAG: lysylphosphatidylglycerol synthase domain-containing protein [Propylenella sp.]